jgi:hypothetical protein
MGYPSFHSLLAGALTGVRCAFLFCIGLSVCSDAFAQNPSSSDSNVGDWFSTSSGWETGEVTTQKINGVPVGNFDLLYKHWFNKPFTGAPFVSHSVVPKPPLATWKNSFVDTKTTLSPPSIAKSDWKVATDTTFPFGDYYTKTQTKSFANALSPDLSAHSRTRIKDPWVMSSPATNPDWDPSYALDPEGKWTVGGTVGMFGEIQGTGNIGFAYKIALDSTNPADAFDLFSVDVSQDSFTIFADDRIDLYKNGVSVTVNDLIASLGTYGTSTGWKLDPGFSFSEFDPGNASQLADVFNVEFRLRLDSSTTSATVFTEHYSGADAVVPEPTSCAIFGLGALGAFVRARLRRKKSDQAKCSS